MITIRNRNERYGDPETSTGVSLACAVANMEATIRDCGPEFADVVVGPEDYEVVDADIAASAVFSDYHCNYLQHKTSGDVFAVMVCHNSEQSTWATLPLHHSEVRNVLAHGFDDKWEDWDDTNFRALTDQDIRDRFIGQ